MKKLSKKANMVTDLFVFIASAFAFGLAMVLMVFLVNEVNDVMVDIAPTLSHDSVNGTKIVEETFGVLPDAYESLKWISYMLIIAMGLSILLGNFLVRTHPIFVIPYIFIIAIAVIVSVPISNTYEELMNHEILGATFQGFFGLSFIFANFPIWVLLFGILGGLLMFINIPRDKEVGDPF